MKIPVIQKICNYIGLLKTKTDKKPEAANVEKSSVPTSYVYPKPLINSTFAQKPISSKCPNYDPLYCDYSNLDEFAAKFSQKIDSQLMTIDKNDIENLIIRLQLKTKASPQLIKNVLTI